MTESLLAGLTICPGPTRTRSPGVVYGTDKPTQPGPVGRPNRIMEWQWAQMAMYGYYYMDFKMLHPAWSFVLSEAEYAYIASGILDIDELLERMSTGFRRDDKRGGRARPDILGIYVGGLSASLTGRLTVGVELLEVTTEKQLAKTFKEDVTYKLQKFDQLVKEYSPAILDRFGSSQLLTNIGPAKWKPVAPWQRIVPLPLREQDGKTFVEWICFEPTFRQNGGQGIDGLLLYEVHSVPLPEAKIAYKSIWEKVRARELEQRKSQQIAFGLTLTPWLTTKTVPTLLDADERTFLLAMVGIGAIALLAYVAIPVVAGIELTALMSTFSTAGTWIGGRLVLAPTVLQGFGMALASTMQTAVQWQNSLAGAR